MTQHEYIFIAISIVLGLAMARLLHIAPDTPLAARHEPCLRRLSTDVESLLDQGANWAANPREVAEQSDVVFSIVGFPADVREIVLSGFGHRGS